MYRKILCVCIRRFQRFWHNRYEYFYLLLGALTLDLAKMPRGSPNSKNCTLELLNPNLPTIDMFKVTRIKAWWPLERSMNAAQYVQAVRIIKI